MRTKSSLVSGVLQDSTHMLLIYGIVSQPPQTACNSCLLSGYGQKERRINPPMRHLSRLQSTKPWRCRCPRLTARPRPFRDLVRVRSLQYLLQVTVVSTEEGMSDNEKAGRRA